MHAPDTSPETETQPTPLPASAAPRLRRRVRLGSETRQRRRRMIRYALLVFSTVLMVNALVGEKGYLASLRARKDVAELETRLRAMQDENARLADQARRLKSDPATLEAVARQDLGLVKPGETLITLRDRPKQVP